MLTTFLVSVDWIASLTYFSTLIFLHIQKKGHSHLSLLEHEQSFDNIYYMAEVMLVQQLREEEIWLEGQQ